MPNRTLGITFAGGGNRAFYQLGLMNVWGDALWPRVGAVAACSAGACVACMILSERVKQTSDFWKRRRAHVTRNFTWSNLLRGDNPAPHAPIYRDTLLHAFADGGFERIRRQPFPIFILAAALPPRLPPALATTLGITAYTVEKTLRKTMIHPSLGKLLGFAPFAHDARACKTPEDLAALILASSATPPFTPVGRYAERPLLDGGMVDNVPAFLLDDAPGVTHNLVLLTRPYPPTALGRRGDRLYLAPVVPTPVGRWDYTRPDLIDATIAQGEAEALQHHSALNAFLQDAATAPS
jgi:predicted acylesterase/phospholipase RssA